MNGLPNNNCIDFKSVHSGLILVIFTAFFVNWMKFYVVLSNQKYQQIIMYIKTDLKDFNDLDVCCQGHDLSD